MRRWWRGRSTTPRSTAWPARWLVTTRSSSSYGRASGPRRWSSACGRSLACRRSRRPSRRHPNRFHGFPQQCRNNQQCRNRRRPKLNGKVVLAYSGGLDTTVAVRWLQEKMGLDVIAVAVDVGQGSDLEAVRGRALETGAVEAHIVDARDELASDFLAPALKANALYQQKYPLVSSLSRPVICRHLVAAARRSGARFVAHGCTGKGNEQVR